MNEPTTVKRRGRPPKKSTRRVENADEPASASEPLDSRDAPSYSVHEDVLIYTTEPASRLIQATVSVHHRQAELDLSCTVIESVHLQIEEPDSDTEAEGNRRAATPSMSHRVVSAAQAAKDTVQDTLTSAMEQAQDLPSKLPFGWPALLGLLLLTLLAGHGLSSMLRPHYKSDDVSYFSRSVDQANHRYHQLKDYVHKTERQLKDTEGRCAIHAMPTSYIFPRENTALHFACCVVGTVFLALDIVSLKHPQLTSWEHCLSALCI